MFLFYSPSVFTVHPYLRSIVFTSLFLNIVYNSKYSKLRSNYASPALHNIPHVQMKDNSLPSKRTTITTGAARTKPLYIALCGMCYKGSRGGL